MSIFFPCVCGKTLQVLDELAGQKYRCKACGATVTVPASAEATAGLPPASASGGADLPGDAAHRPALKPLPGEAAPAAPTRRCPSCGESLPPRAGVCPKCGHDAERGERRCVRCQGPVALDDDTDFGSTEGAFVGGLMIVGYWLVGWLALSIGVAGLSLIRLVCGLSARYKCRMCRKDVKFERLSAEEKRSVRALRGKLILQSAGLGALAVVIFGVWAWVVFYLIRR